MKNEIKEHVEKLLPLMEFNYNKLLEVFEELCVASEQKKTLIEVAPSVEKYLALFNSLLPAFSFIETYGVMTKKTVIDSYYIMDFLYKYDPSVISEEDLQKFKAKENEIIRLQKEVDALEEISENYIKEFGEKWKM